RPAEAERERRRDAPVLDRHRVAARYVALVAEQVQPQRGTVRQAMIGVECRPQVLVGAAPERRAVEILGPGLFRDEVARAAGRPAPRVGGARALGHLDLLEREHVAGLRARIADAVDEHVRARIEAADLEVVTGRYAA